MSFLPSFTIGQAQRANRTRLLAVFLYGFTGLFMALLMRGLRLDDPFITYRYAENLAAGNGFVFNPGQQTLITTAPLYALILVLPRLLGADIPAASYVIGVVSLIGAAYCLYLFGEQHTDARIGFLAGLFLLLAPLNWLAIGFETPLFLAVSLLALLTAAHHRPNLAGVLAGIALGLRGDGFIVLAIAMLITVEFGNGKWRIASAYYRSIRLAVVAIAVYAPLAIWLTMQFGSPLPSTLQTKSAQAISGLTGFYAGTTYIEGAYLLIKAYLAQSAAYILLLLAALSGVIRLAYLVWSHRSTELPPHNAPYLPVLAWMGAHFVGYSLIHVAPYPWYYVPMLPGVACLVASGVGWAWSHKPTFLASRFVPVASSLLVCVPLVIGNLAMVRVLSGAIPPPPSEIDAKVLPETKVDSYERVGEWLRDSTPATATIGVTELGVISYYAGRNAVDFLGLTQPEHLAAIQHGDYLQSLIREQPDYIALTSVNAIYDIDPQRESWFTSLYKPVVSFADARFWGSPMTVWQRQRAKQPVATLLDSAEHDLGDGWRLTAITASSRKIVAGSPIFLRLKLQAGDPTPTRTLRVQPIVLEGGDGLPVVSRLIYAKQWRQGETDWVDFPIMPQPNPRKGGYIVTANWLDNTIVVKAGTLKVSLDEPLDPQATVAALSQGIGVELLSQPITACIGAITPLTVTWRGGDMNDPAGPASSPSLDYTAFVHVRNTENETIVLADAPPRNGTYPTSVWSAGERIPDIHALQIPATVAPGAYSLVVGLYDPASNTRLPVAPSVYRTPDGGVNIGVIAVQECGH